MILFDTDILIDASHNRTFAVQALASHSEKAAVSTMTQMELLVGCRNKRELSQTQEFLKRFTILHLTESISECVTALLTQYTLSHGLEAPDALIAATAITYSLPLLSKNQRDYRFIEKVNLLPYPLVASSPARHPE